MKITYETLPLQHKDNKNLVFHKIQVINIPVIDFVKQKINAMQNNEMTTNKGKFFTAPTIHSYKNLVYHLEIFQKNYDQFQFHDITPKFIAEFKNYLLEQKLSTNTISTIISKLKSILNFAFSEGLTIWNGSGISTPREKTTQVYLSEKEITKIYNCENLTPGQRDVVDRFVIQFFTGLRISTLNKFLSEPLSYIEEYEGQNYIVITADKNEEEVVIPLSEMVIEIIAKHKGGFKTITDQYYNRTIKKVSEKANVSRNIVNRTTKGGKTIESIVSKFKMIKSHTARRSFATLLNRELSKEQIKPMTGHRSDAQLETYIRTTNIQKVSQLGQVEFFKKKLHI